MQVPLSLVALLHAIEPLQSFHRRFYLRMIDHLTALSDSDTPETTEPLSHTILELLSQTCVYSDYLDHLSGALHASHVLDAAMRRRSIAADSSSRRSSTVSISVPLIAPAPMRVTPKSDNAQVESSMRCGAGAYEPTDTALQFSPQLTDLLSSNTVQQLDSSNASSPQDALVELIDCWVAAHARHSRWQGLIAKSKRSRARQFSVHQCVGVPDLQEWAQNPTFPPCVLSECGFENVSYSSQQLLLLPVLWLVQVHHFMLHLVSKVPVVVLRFVLTAQLLSAAHLAF